MYTRWRKYRDSVARRLSKNASVRLFTSKPDIWKNEIEVYDSNNNLKYVGYADIISNNPDKVVTDADIIINSTFTNISRNHEYN